MTSAQITLKPSTFVVFEGLDATGKTTQMDRIRNAASGQFGHRLFTHPHPLFTHQPSGNDRLGDAIYRLTEDYTINNPWCRQFLHLASHANHYENQILPTLRSGQSLFMDRCWWSTFAYGYCGGGIIDSEEMRPDEFIKIARIPTQGQMPSVVFLFMHPHKEDAHNTPQVRAGYEVLAQAEMTYPVVHVPLLGIEETTAYIFKALVDLELTA